ncbi:MAG: hypothetical protein C4538_04120 [Nitrospiraceae bacterium]|nr:MAG: hypothetical protein C4538_04120 [Nitrospiraceae bacterium]
MSIRVVALFYLIISLLPFFCSNAYAADQGMITVHYPPDRTVREFGVLSVSLSVPEGSADLLKVIVNDVLRVEIKPERTFACFTVPIKLGVNTINISALKGVKQVDSAAFSVFRKSDLEGKFISPLPIYRKDNFHIKDNGKCAQCHKLEPVESDLKPFNGASIKGADKDREKALSATSTCYSCHKKITSYKYVHGPAAVWSCLSCHDKIAEPKYAVKKPDTEVCFACHTDKKKEWSAMKYTHGPVTIGKCAICHSPHASDYAFNLVKPTWDLCTTCHFEKGTGTHVLGDSIFAEGHPTRNRPDPMRKGQELTCASCHSPHTSNFPHLWAFDVNSLYEFCQKCHNK